MTEELVNMLKLPSIFFGTIKTGKNVLVSENLGNMTNVNVQPFLETLANSLYHISTTFWTKTDPVTYVRTATTIKDSNGNYVIGTTLDPANPAYTALQNGLPYVGNVNVFGTTYFAYYIPIYEPGTTFLIGAYGITLEVITIVTTQECTASNITFLQYLTGPVNTNTAGVLVTKNQGDLTTETYQPILEILDRLVTNSNTLFKRVGDDFIRVATTLLVENNKYAVGYTLARDSPAYLPLLSGNSYQGIVQLFGYNYYAKYTPIFDSFTGFVIGAYFSGYNL
jgi:hypothetical protein